MIPLIKYSRKCEQIYSDRKEISCCLGLGERVGGRSQRAPKTLGVTDMFMILIVTMAY